MNGRVLMVGAGGMGMVPLALLRRAAGEAVLGWDDALTEGSRAALAGGGVELLAAPVWPEGLTVSEVVRSAAVSPGHPLLVEARRHGVPVSRRGEALAAWARGRKLVAVAGSHGKTTTTALLVTLLRGAGVPFSWAIGGLPADGTPPGGGNPSAAWMVAEVDESDGTQEGFAPAVAVIVNLDWDHPDEYASEEALYDAFGRFMGRASQAIVVPRGGRLEALARSVAAPGVTVLTVGPEADNAVTVAPDGVAGTRLEQGGRVLTLPGWTFQGTNAALAWAAASVVAGAVVDPAPLADFGGLRRRQARLWEEAGRVVVYEDYAHHPSELAALFDWARRRHPDRKLVVVFQPHRYTRTAILKAAFADVLAAADRLVLLDVYSAGESPVAGGTTRDLEALLAPEVAARTRCVSWQEELERELDAALQEPSVLLFVGAGDIDGWARTWVRSRAAAVQAAADTTSAKAPAAAVPAPAAPAAASTSGGRRVDWLSDMVTKLRPETRCAWDWPLAPATTLRVGGVARWYAEPASVEDLQQLRAAAQAAGVPVFLLGRGSNLVVAESGFDGLVLRLAGGDWTTVTRGAEPGTLVAGGGARLKALCAEAARAGWGGLEFLDGIPGTVGGSLRMNAGAMGGWIFERVREVTVLTPSGEILTRPRADFHPVYRDCPELRQELALGAVFSTAGEVGPDAVRAQLDAFAQVRKRTQPREASAGCMFKNPPGDAAGRLIDACGLKGRRVGDAEVSTRHANFIINRGAARAGDVLALVRLVRTTVERAQGVTLEPEAILLGCTWEEVWAA